MCRLWSMATRLQLAIKHGNKLSSTWPAWTGQAFPSHLVLSNHHSYAPLSWSDLAIMLPPARQPRSSASLTCVLGRKSKCTWYAALAATRTCHLTLTRRRIVFSMFCCCQAVEDCADRLDDKAIEQICAFTNQCFPAQPDLPLTAGEEDNSTTAAAAATTSTTAAAGTGTGTAGAHDSDADADAGNLY